MTEANQSPREIVAQLDRYIVGQNEAKRAVAIALRNRYRRLQLDGEMQKEVTPKNILMIGPTGVGKTEIARRLANIVEAPFVKVEATKFTEVGYVGRDVESMVRDLLMDALRIIKKQKYSEVYSKAARIANEKLAKVLVPGLKKEKKSSTNQFEAMMSMFNPNPEAEEKEETNDAIITNRKTVFEQLEKGLLENREVTIEVKEVKPKMPMMNNGLEQMGIDLSDAFQALNPPKKVKRTLTVKEAREVIIAQEQENLVNEADIEAQAIELTENAGIIFIDEIDKITSKSQNSGEVSREGVQRDILPIVEGSQIQTKYGSVKTDHILFIASGAFHVSKPADLIPELQGRFPIRVELADLSKEDFIRILTEPKNSLIRQYTALLKTENVTVKFTQEAIEKIAEIAFEVNGKTDNIGARRLHTILEKLLEELLFEASELEMAEVLITENYVVEKLGAIVEDEDLSRYIL